MRLSTFLGPLAAAVLMAAGLTVSNAPEVSAASTVGGSITRAEVIARAKYWYDRGDTWYSQAQSDAISDGDGHSYRPDCSGLVSMAWHLPKKSDGWDLNTDDFFSYSGKTWLGSLNDLLPGDALLRDGHMELFEKWVNPGDHTDGAWVYSENTYGQKTNHNINTWSEMTTYRGIRYTNIGSGGADRTTGDVSGDGYGDLTAIDAQGHLVVYANGLLLPAYGGLPFQGAYWRSGNSNWNRDARSITTADVSGDHYADYLVLTTSGHLQVFANSSLIGDGSPFVAPYVDYPNWAGYTNIAAGDINADGFADLAATRADGHLHIYLNTRETGPNAMPFRNLRWDYPSGWGTDVTDIALGDVSGDGYADLLGVRTDGTLTMFGNGLLLPAFGGYPFVGATWIIHGAYDQVADITVSQIDSDGYADLMLVINGVLNIYLNNHDPVRNYISSRWSYIYWQNVYHIA